jgi:hypothetical protein
MNEDEKKAAERLAVTVLRLCPEAEEVTMGDQVILRREEVDA